MITAEELAAILEAVGAHIASEIDRKLTEPLTRLAAVEARPLPRDGRDGAPGVPGPAGECGAAGRNGIDGRHGLDGLGFDELAVAHDGERTLTLRAACAETAREKVIGTITLPIPIYRGVYTVGKTYVPHDRVTYGGSEWHCLEETATRPGESKAWILVVKKGRDGRDAAR